jgi:hypothetical protein
MYLCIYVTVLYSYVPLWTMGMRWMDEIDEMDMRPDFSGFDVRLGIAHVLLFFPPRIVHVLGGVRYLGEGDGYDLPIDNKVRIEDR